jgi:hypothetical protein
MKYFIDLKAYISFTDIFFFEQDLSQGSGGTVTDLIGLDVHAISDLQNRNIPTTDDAPKYNYQATESGQYSKCNHRDWPI